MTFDKALIQPRFPKSLDWARVELSNGKGRIVSEWKRENEQIMLTVERKYIDYELDIPKNFHVEVIEEKGKHVVYKLMGI